MKIFKITTITVLVAAYFISAQFAQTPFAYAYNTLEPYVDVQTMEMHYAKHAKGYVDNLNKAIAGSPLEKENMEQTLSHISKESATVRNNADGHYNHELFWKVLTPNKNTQHSKKLLKAIDETFWSMGNFKTEMAKAGAGRFSSGWAWLIVTPEKNWRSSTANQDNQKFICYS